MPAPKGNQFWKARTTYGTEKLFESPDSLWDAACEYFQWVEENPLWETKVGQYQAQLVELPIDKMRAMTIQGLCLFLNTTKQTLNNYESKEGYEDYFDVVKKIKSVIYDQKFSGAAAGLLNSNIIARDLGLAEKSTVTVKDGGKYVSADMSPQDAARAYQDLMANDE